MADRTALVGRNESGKSNLLLALSSLNPPGGILALSATKDFPRDRPLSEFSEDIHVVDSTWTLGNQGRRKLGEIFPRAADVSCVTVGRDYGTQQFVDFLDLPDLSVNYSMVNERLTNVSRSVIRSLRDVNPSTAKEVRGALDELLHSVGSTDMTATDWAAALPSAVDSFNRSVKAASITLADRVADNLSGILTHASSIRDDDTAHQKARNWIVKQLPVFMYLSEYPELHGHQNIAEYLERKHTRQLEESDQNFEKLMKVAGLDPAQLHTLLSNSHEDRQLLTNRAGANVTRELRKLWKDRALKVRFALDADHFNTIISDPNAVYDVEVNLDERSRGLKWFFSFYITFAADTSGGAAENAILMLDEPGLHLHVTAQRDLLEHFANDFENQILYTTHSPFMVPIKELAAIRTVNIDAEEGTTVTNDPTGDARTLFPLQAAIGWDLTQSMFIGQHNIVVEGVTDYWYLSAISEHLRDAGGHSLPHDLVITPAGGAQKVSYMATLLVAQRLNVLVLLDDETAARDTADELIRNKLVRKDNVIFTSEGFATPPKGGADIEDLLEPQVYENLVNQSYAKELLATPITLNPNIPRIVKRYEDAFVAAGMAFHKTRPAKLFLQEVGKHPAIITPITKQNFETLFRTIDQQLQKLKASEREPFR